MSLPGYDRWLESGPGGPYDDGEVECPDCDGGGETGLGPDALKCRRCDGTGQILASDAGGCDEPDEDDEDDDDAL